MQKNTNESEEKRQKLEKRNNIWDWIIGVILAGITLITIQFQKREYIICKTVILKNMQIF